MARRRKIGDVYAIPLPDGTYAFGRVLLGSSEAFYKHRGQNTNDLPPTEDYAGLEVCATWAHIHLVKRLIGDESWKKYFPRFYEE